MSEHFYRAYEDHCRASEPAFKEHCDIYTSLLGCLREAFGESASVLDLGYGHEQWVGMLSTLGFQVLSIDGQSGKLEATGERKLLVDQGDLMAVMDGLRKTADSSLALVSAFHVVERLPFSELEMLFQEALRVLRPGGILMLEMPSSQMLAMSSYLFDSHPRQGRPISAHLLRFMPEHYGFVRTHIWQLQTKSKLTSEQPPSFLEVFQEAGSAYTVLAQKVAPIEVMELFDRDFKRTVGANVDGVARRYDARLERIEALQLELLAVYQSHSWKITKPVRQLRVWLSRAFSELRVFKSALGVQCHFVAEFTLALLIGTLKRYPHFFRYPERFLQKCFPRFYSIAVNCFFRRKLQAISPRPLGERGQKIYRQLDQGRSFLADD